MSAFTETALQFTSLTSLTLSLPKTIPSSSWSMVLRSLTAHSPLTGLHLYINGGLPPDSPPVADVVDSVLDLHASTLRKFSVHRITLSPEMVMNICDSCPSLEILFLRVADSALVRSTIIFWVSPCLHK